jgi:hypothetical protein
MTNLQTALAEYEAAHAIWFNTSIYAPKEKKDEVDKNLKETRAKYDAAYKKEFPNHGIISFS